MTTWATWIPESLWRAMEATGLTPNQRLVLVAICHFTAADGAGARPGMARLADMTGLHHRTVRRCVQQLSETDLLEVTPGDRRRPNRYAVRFELSTDCGKGGGTRPPPQNGTRPGGGTRPPPVGAHGPQGGGTRPPDQDQDQDQDQGKRTRRVRKRAGPLSEQELADLARVCKPVADAYRRQVGKTPNEGEQK